MSEPPCAVPKGRPVKPAPFDYHCPGELAEAIAILQQYGEEAKVLAGGQSLIPLLSLRLSRFDHLVDLQAIEELRGVTVVDGSIRVGAMTTQAGVARSNGAAAVPLLTKATCHIGHFQIRNRGTLGGSLAHADPAAEYPAVALALDASLEIAGPNGSRRVPAADFFAPAFHRHLHVAVHRDSVSHRIIADWNPHDQQLTVWSSTQSVHGVQGFLAGLLGISTNQIRVLQPDVGGGFGQTCQPLARCPRLKSAISSRQLQTRWASREWEKAERLRRPPRSSMPLRTH
jgi:hypothetical protein